MTTTNNFNPHLPQPSSVAANAYGLPDPRELEAWALPYFPEFGGTGASASVPKTAAYGERPNLSGHGVPDQSAYADQAGIPKHSEPAPRTAPGGLYPSVSEYGVPNHSYGERANVSGYSVPGQSTHGVHPNVSGYSEPGQSAYDEHANIPGYREPAQAAHGERRDFPEYREPAHAARNPVTAEEAEYLSLLSGLESFYNYNETASIGTDTAASGNDIVSRNNDTAPRGNDTVSQSNNTASRGNDTGYSPVVVPATGTPTGRSGFDVNAVRADFPILNEKVNGGKQLVWLDNGATTQKPRQVIDRISYFYEHENSNIHRAAHELAARSSDAYEAAREITANFLGAPSKDNIVFVRGTTEGINLVAQAYVKPILSPGDEIILTILEHHANIVPWQIIAQETGAVIKVAPVDDSGQIILSEYARLFSRRTKFVSATHVSNALGTVTPVHEMVRIAHGCGVRILIDGAQSVAHTPVNMGELDADFFVLSGHKIFAPTGIGALYGRADALEEAKPYQGGGNMIKDVTFERTVYNPPPNKFEAGTGNIADAIGLGAALDYVSKVGIADISAYEHELLDYATGRLNRIKGLRLIGTAAEKASVLSFVMDNVSVQEVGKHLSNHGIAVRAGHHCAQPILRRFGLEATVRPTLAFYNTAEEVDILANAITELVK